MRLITVALIKEFRDYLTNEEKSLSTISKYIHDVTAFMNWLNGEDVTKTVVLDYKSYIVDNYAASSVNVTISSLNSFFMFNEWYDLKIKSLRIQKQVFASKEKELAKSEYEQLLYVAKQRKNKRLYYLIQTICSTGIRVSELKFITVNAVKQGQAVINCKGKMRTVILPKQLCRMLGEYIKEKNIKNGCVFVTKTGTPLNRSNIWSDMKRLCKSAGVSENKVFPHNLRHLFARTYYSSEKDIARLADILGHSSINTTRIYTMESSEIHRRRLQKLGLLIY